ncbi:MAG: preprotein translocase subunit SecG [Rickettsiales bacterium]|nr:MAG: preprotein translocase subunit SecG [Rickettsiales bacterium]
MINTLLFVHMIISALLIVVILLQKTSKDGLSGIGGGGNNMGVVSGRSAATFLTRTTIILAVAFFANALVLANLSAKRQESISAKIQKTERNATKADSKKSSLPMAK